MLTGLVGYIIRTRELPQIVASGEDLDVELR